MVIFLGLVATVILFVPCYAIARFARWCSRKVEQRVDRRSRIEIACLAAMRGWHYQSVLPPSKLDAILQTTSIPTQTHLRGSKVVRFEAEDETFFVFEVNDPHENLWVVVSIHLKRPIATDLILPDGWTFRDGYCSYAIAAKLKCNMVESLLIEACRIAENIQEQVTKTAPSLLESRPPSSVYTGRANPQLRQNR